MGYEIDKIQEVIMYDKNSDEEIGHIHPGPIQAVEEQNIVVHNSVTIVILYMPNTREE